ncbi:N-acetyl-gamma-glutamyl-phosphate reductase [Spirochaeta dissipatitropha]
MKTAIIGANGYIGMTLTRLLLQHPRISDLIPASRSLAGSLLTDYDPGIPESSRNLELCKSRFVSPDEVRDFKPDVVFSALPHLTSAELCAEYIGKIPVFDLSADFRLKSDERFRTAYGQDRPYPELQQHAVYGLVEWYREELKTAGLIACPGCYPTASLLPLIPFLRAGLIESHIHIHAMSGLTGAGKKAQMNLLLAERSENMNAYLPGRSHRHWSEISQEIGIFNKPGNEPELLFTPHLVPMKQGMLATITTRLKDNTDLDQDALHDLLYKAYADSACVEVLKPGTLPMTKSVRGTSRCQISIQKEGSNLLLFSAIDNLYKGAASQAVQAMNIRMGFEETCGLPIFGEV